MEWPNQDARCQEGERERDGGRKRGREVWGGVCVRGERPTSPPPPPTWMSRVPSSPLPISHLLFPLPAHTPRAPAPAPDALAPPPIRVVRIAPNHAAAPRHSRFGQNERLGDSAIRRFGNS